VKEKK